MKYIDADLLRKYIEEKMGVLWNKLPDADKEHPTDIELRDLGMYMAFENIEEDLDSLHQEQPSLPDNLDEAAEEYMKKARKHLFDNSPIGRSDDAFKAGAEWMAKQMNNDN